MEIPVEKRIRRKKKLPGEKEDDLCCRKFGDRYQNPILNQINKTKNYWT